MNSKTLARLARVVLAVVVMAAALSLAPPASGQSPSAEISNVTYSKSSRGVTVTFTLRVHNLRNKSVIVCLFMTDANNQYIRHAGSNSQYASRNGTLTSQEDATPRYDHSKWSSFSLYIPYNQFPSGTYKAYPTIQVLYNGQNIGDYDRSDGASSVQITGTGSGSSGPSGYKVPQAHTIELTESNFIQMLKRIEPQANHRNANPSITLRSTGTNKASAHIQFVAKEDEYTHVEIDLDMGVANGRLKAVIAKFRVYRDRWTCEFDKTLDYPRGRKSYYDCGTFLTDDTEIYNKDFDAVSNSLNSTLAAAVPGYVQGFTVAGRSLLVTYKD